MRGLLCIGLALATSASMTAQSTGARATFPVADEADLDNGLHLIVIEDRRKPEIAFQLLIPGTGGATDPADQRGLAVLTAALLGERTLTRTSGEIAAQLQTMNAHLAIDAGASAPDVVISGSCPRSAATKLLDLVTDLVLNPAFAEEDIARYQAQHPPTAPQDRISRDAILEFHRTRYGPDRAVLAIVGDVSPFAAKFFISQKLSDWKKTGWEPAADADSLPSEQPRVLVVDELDSTHTTLVLGTQGVALTSPDYDVLRLLTRLVGRNLIAPKYPDEWHVEASVPTEAADVVLRNLLEIMRSLRETGVDDATLVETKRELVESFNRSLESTAGLATYAVTRWRHKLPADYWETHAARIEAISADRVQAAAREYLAPDGVQIVMIR